MSQLYFNILRDGLFARLFIYGLYFFTTMQNKETLNQQFGLRNHLQFSQEDEGFVMIDISNDYAKARISAYAGQVLSFKPHTESEDVLFLSDNALYKQDKSIRGGAPVCWPCFGADTSGFGRPFHGFVRNQQWNVIASKQLTDGRTLISLGITDADIRISLGPTYIKGSLAIWPYTFKLQLDVIVGENIEISLTTHNVDNKSFEISQALHTYFNISDVSNISIQGLDGKDYLDKLSDFSSKNQVGDVVIENEIDRVYQQTSAPVFLVDKGLNRTVKVTSSGSTTTVVWNPWSKSVTKIADLDKNSYKEFLCIETANAADDVQTIPPGGSHTMTARYEVI